MSNCWLFSGGTAFNGVVEELKNFTTRVAHVLPVSDDGGSTAEIVRVLGKSSNCFQLLWTMDFGFWCISESRLWVSSFAFACLVTLITSAAKSV